jgi:hypothetical protein
VVLLNAAAGALSLRLGEGLPGETWTDYACGETFRPSPRGLEVPMDGRSLRILC